MTLIALEQSVEKKPPLKKRTGIMAQQLKEYALPIGLVVTMICAFLGGATWIGSEMNSLRAQIAQQSSAIAAIEASRITANQGLEIWQAISSIKERIATLNNDQPLWLKSQLDDIRERLKRIEDKK